MNSRNDIELLIHKYLDSFPEDEAATRHFVSFVEQFDGEMLYNRKNFAGHITASAIVANRDMNCFLLLEHVQLKKWLQPGGHVEREDESVLAAARREVEEETGISPDMFDMMSTVDGNTVIDLDSHYIAACDYKNEAEHYHHDVRFVFRLKSDADVKLDLAESKSYKWVSLEELPLYFGIDRMTRKMLQFTVPVTCENRLCDDEHCV